MNTGAGWQRKVDGVSVLRDGERWKVVNASGREVLGIDGQSANVGPTLRRRDGNKELGARSSPMSCRSTRTQTRPGFALW